jgi:anthranilate phosphoribosyltransferase
VLGPLTNPAGAPNQLLGVYADHWVRPLAEVLGRLGSRHVMVVHAKDGLDEISIAASTRVAELRDGNVTEYLITPEEFGLASADLDAIRVDSATASLEMVRGVLANQAGPPRDIVVLNAGAAIYVAGVTEDLKQGVARAQEVIADGSAAARLDRLVELTRSF